MIMRLPRGAAPNTSWRLSTRTRTPSNSSQGAGLTGRLTFQASKSTNGSYKTLMKPNIYKTSIVTGGGQDFERVYSERVDGSRPEQVVGTADRTGRAIYYHS